MNVSFRNGDLTIFPHLGLIENDRGETVRLGPISMKVLVVLISRPHEVVSRNELFHGVWPNQMVNDDTLTRCISDIRGQLNQLSRYRGHIETLPKRGYRWVTQHNDHEVEVDTTPDSIDVVTARRGGSRIKDGLTSLVLYLTLSLVCASAGVWLISVLLLPSFTRIAILPVELAGPSHQSIAPQLADALRTHLMVYPNTELLAPRAVITAPENPFPYLHREYGVDWLIDIQVAQGQDTLHIAIHLVDARTAIVHYSFTRKVPEHFSDWRGLSSEFAMQVRQSIHKE